MAAGGVTPWGDIAGVAGLKPLRLTQAEIDRKVLAAEEENARLRRRVADLEAWKAKVQAFVGRYAIEIATQFKRL